MLLRDVGNSLTINTVSYLEYLNPQLRILSRSVEKNKMDRACSMYGERRDPYKVLVGKPEGKKPLGRPSCKGRKIL